MEPEPETETTSRVVRLFDAVPQPAEFGTQKDGTPLLDAERNRVLVPVPPLLVDRTSSTMLFTYRLTACGTMGGGAQQWVLQPKIDLMHQPDIKRVFKHRSSLKRLLFVSERVTKVYTRNVFAPFDIDFSKGGMYHPDYPWGRTSRQAVTCTPVLHIRPCYQHAHSINTGAVMQQTHTIGAEGILYRNTCIDLECAFMHSQVDIAKELDAGVVQFQVDSTQVGIKSTSVLGQTLYANPDSRKRFNLEEDQTVYTIGCNGVLRFLKYWHDLQKEHTQHIVFDRTFPTAAMIMCPLEDETEDEGLLAMCRLPVLTDRTRRCIEFPQNALLPANPDDAKTQLGYQLWRVDVDIEIQVVMHDLYYESTGKANPYPREIPLPPQYLAPVNAEIEKIMKERNTIGQYTSKDVLQELARDIFEPGGVLPGESQEQPSHRAAVPGAPSVLYTGAVVTHQPPPVARRPPTVASLAPRSERGPPSISESYVSDTRSAYSAEGSLWATMEEIKQERQLRGQGVQDKASMVLEHNPEAQYNISQRAARRLEDRELDVESEASEAYWGIPSLPGTPPPTNVHIHM